jgi:hypothetical protein
MLSVGVMMRTRLSIFILVGLILSVVACVGPGDIAEIATVDASPSATLPPESATAETFVTTSPAATNTAVTVTSTPIPSEQPTNTPIPGTPTPDYAELDMNTETSTSPDGVWMAELILAYPTGGETPDYYQSLTVRRVDGSVTWVLVDNWSLWALGATYPRIVGWSSQVFYFSEYGVADGCGLFGVDLNVRRLSLEDGSVSEIPIEAGSLVALSPDGTSAAYVTRDSDAPQIVVHDLATGEQHSALLDVGDDFWGAGNVVWSPDGQSLMLTVDHNGCGPDTARSIIRVDVPSLAQRILIDHGDRLFRTQSWPEADRVVLRERDVGLWWMDAATGEIIGPKPDG